jgi:hypothetical protein
MNDEPAKGDGSGASYSGYTVFAGELNYDSFDNGQVGYKVYIGPGQYFVITDIGKGRYQWYAFLSSSCRIGRIGGETRGIVQVSAGHFRGLEQGYSPYLAGNQGRRN